MVGNLNSREFWSVLTALTLVLLAGCSGSEQGAGAKSAASTATPSGTAATATPEKSFVEVEGGTTYNFGTTEMGQEFDHVFVIKNISQEKIHITKGQPSCATCTSFEIDKLDLEPGDVAKATVKWRIKAENPEFSQYAPFSIMTPKRPDGETVKLFVQGKVVKRIVLSPVDRWDLGAMKEGQPKTFVATLTSSVVPNLKIEEITSGSPDLTVTAKPIPPEELEKLDTKDAKIGFTLTATLAPTIQVGDFTTTVTIKVLTPEERLLKVDVHAVRSGPLRIFGPNYSEERMTLSLGSFDPHKEFSTRLNVFTRGITDELKIDKLETEPADPRFTVELKPDPKFKSEGDSRRYDLFVKVAPSDRAAVYTREQPLLIILTTNQPAIGKIKLTIRSAALK